MHVPCGHVTRGTGPDFAVTCLRSHEKHENLCHSEASALPTHLSPNAALYFLPLRSTPLFLSFLSPVCTLGRIPNPSQALIPARPHCQIGFHTVPGPSLLPRRRSCHLSVAWRGCRPAWLWLRIELWESFAGSGRSTTQSLRRQDEQLTVGRKKNSGLYGNVACV